VLLALCLLAVVPSCKRSYEAPEPPPSIPAQAPKEHLHGAAERGEELFRGAIQEGVPPCIACHSVESDRTRICPSLRHIARVAGQRVAGMDAAAYLRQSIVDPNAYIVPGFSSELMPKIYGKVLSDADVEDLVAYLLTRTGGSEHEEREKER
jgi:cytochrome c553